MQPALRAAGGPGLAPRGHPGAFRGVRGLDSALVSGGWAGPLDPECWAGEPDLAGGLAVKNRKACVLLDCVHHCPARALSPRKGEKPQKRHLHAAEDTSQSTSLGRPPHQRPCPAAGGRASGLAPPCLSAPLRSNNSLALALGTLGSLASEAAHELRPGQPGRVTDGSPLPRNLPLHRRGGLAAVGLPCGPPQTLSQVGMRAGAGRGGGQHERETCPLQTRGHPRGWVPGGWVAGFPSWDPTPEPLESASSPGWKAW